MNLNPRLVQKECCAFRPKTPRPRPRGARARGRFHGARWDQRRFRPIVHWFHTLSTRRCRLWHLNRRWPQHFLLIASHPRVATPIAGQGTSAATYHKHPNYISLLDRAHIRAAVDLIIAHMPCHARRAALEVEYTNSVGSEAEELQRRGFELHEVGGAEAIARWAAARARHHPGGRDDKGCAEGTAQALKVARKQLIICGACGALVQLQAARRLARKAGRSRIADGDGCGSSTCTTSHAQPRRFLAASRAGRRSARQACYTARTHLCCRRRQRRHARTCGWRPRTSRARSPFARAAAGAAATKARRRSRSSAATISLSALTILPHRRRKSCSWPKGLAVKTGVPMAASGFGLEETTNTRAPRRAELRPTRRGQSHFRH